MKIIDIFTRLDEGRKEDLMQMIPANILAAADSMNSSYRKIFQDEINWSLHTLKKQDRIIWFLRLVRIELLELLEVALENYPNATPDMVASVKKMLSKYQSEIPNDSFPIRRIKGHLEHFLSLNLPKIESIVFKKQTPTELVNEMSAIELEWKETTTQLIKSSEIQGREKTLISFPDGKQWVDLNRYMCSVEGRAMGHCGNAGNPGPNDTILSLREPVKGGWRPLLTFILDKKTGLLGEMKGRGNDKPADRYHSYIIALLKNPMVKGIAGGGYLPKNNFSLNDLPEETKHALLKEKPALADWYDLYLMNGLTPSVKERMSKFFEYDGITFNSNDEDTRLQKFSDAEDFVSAYEDSLPNAKYALGLYNGEIYSDIVVDDYDIQRLYDSFPEDIQELIQEYTRKTYPSESDDALTVLESMGDTVYDDLRSASAHANLSGIFRHISKDIQFWFKEQKIVSGIEDIRIEMSNPDSWYNSEIYIELPTKVFMKTLKELKDDELYHTFDRNSILEFYDIPAAFRDLQEPYNGWGGFDEKAGWEDFYNSTNTELLPLPPLSTWEE